MPPMKSENGKYRKWKALTFVVLFVLLNFGCASAESVWLLETNVESLDDINEAGRQGSHALKLTVDESMTSLTFQIQTDPSSVPMPWIYYYCGQILGRRGLHYCGSLTLPTLTYDNNVTPEQVAIPEKYRTALESGFVITQGDPFSQNLPDPLVVIGSNIDAFEKGYYPKILADFPGTPQVQDTETTYNGRSIYEYNLILIGGPKHNSVSKQLYKNSAEK